MGVDYYPCANQCGGTYADDDYVLCAVCEDHCCTDCADTMRRRRHVDRSGLLKDHSRCDGEQKDGTFYLCYACSGSRISDEDVVEKLRELYPNVLAELKTRIRDDQKAFYKEWEDQRGIETESVADADDKGAGSDAQAAHEKPEAEPDEARDAKRAKPETAGDANAQA